MSVTFVAAAHVVRPSSGSGSPAVVPKPTGVVAGDLLILHIASNGGSPPSLTIPTGWTALPNSLAPGCYRIADGTEGTSFSFAYSTANTSNTFAISAWRGTDAAAPFRSGGATGTTVFSPGNSSPTAPSATATAGDLVVRLIQGYQNSGVSNPQIVWPAGVTQDFDSGETAPIGLGVVSLAHATAPSTGATGAVTASAVRVSDDAANAVWGRHYTYALAPAPDAAPVNTTAPAVTGTPAVGATLTCDNGAWTNSPTTFTRQWRSDGVAITGATSSTYVISANDAGHTITCAVTASNAAGTGTPAVSNGVAIPAPPAFSVAPAITTDGTPATGETITCSSGTASGSPTYSYQWYRGASPIAGETTNAYVLAVTDEGANITCRVTATNGGGQSTASSNAITPAVSAPLSDASFLNYLSGGTNNTDPALSIGGERGATYPGGLNGLIGPILGSVAQSGGTFYRVIYIRNTHTTSTAVGLKLFLESQFTHPGLSVAAGVPAEGANATVPPLASQTTEPAGVTWITTTTPAQGAAFGNLAPGAYRGIYLRFTVEPGTKLTSQADAVVAVEGTAG